ncbi:thyroglobulin [Alosa sapidissima]|uniref:thyroglobulin n=1 Tax=Alosa sapidissima TaxID=34773 RepID=UPI001C0A5AB1|nr:thyroglobulin [Alosa sapidissima]
MGLICLTVLLAASLTLGAGKISEYQLESETLSQCELLRGGVGAAQQRDHVPQCSEDGRFRHVQCSSAAAECWCVDSEGSELPGSRQNGSAIHCLTSCQQHRQRVLQRGNDDTLLPACSDSGEYQPVQCQPTTGQCWCVDQEGMEIYGTRQNGRPARCPGSCEVRERRLLHGVGEPSPPQCSDDGLFLPVQCKFINTTDRMVFDLLHTFNRHPELFQTFSGFRKTFPEISSYCFCADSRGRELPSTGLELLLDDVYDTAFSDTGAGRSFGQSNMYRILHRRFLAVQLAMTGRFRCPTPCESEKSAASKAANVFVPSCDASGLYMPTQCQAGGQCWCVGADGREVFGTRQQGQPDCSAGLRDCQSERRQALSRLFSGPVAVRPADPRHESATPFSVCSPEFQELLAKSGLLQSLSESDRSDMGDILSELVQGMFPSGALALKALSLIPNPKRLQENLFGGKFLKNAGNFNFTGAVGSSGTLSFSQTFSQVGVTLSGAQLEQLAKIFSPESGMVMVNLDQMITDAFGRSVSLKGNQDLIRLLGSTLESEPFLATLREAITVLKAEDSTQLGSLFRAVFQGSDPDRCQSPSQLYVPQCDQHGQFEEVQCTGSECWCVDSRGQEVKGSRTLGSRPRCPSQCEKERDAAIRAKGSMSAGVQVYVPKCEESGVYVQRQCLGQSCFCVDRSGSKLSTPAAGTQQCPTDCQSSAAEAFLSTIRSVLSDPSAISRLSDIYIPRCAPDGRWHQVQCDGPPEQAFQFHKEWVQLNNGGQDLAVPELLSLLRSYGKNPAAMSSFGGFLSALFEAGHHKVFPMLRTFATFADLPQEMVKGQVDAVSGPSVFLNPLSMWTLLKGDASRYPGSLSDFSLPLGHVDLRQCWCVSPAGDIVPNTKAPLNQVPKCPGSCALAEQEVTQFLAMAEDLISVSNSSHVPMGYSFLLAEGVRLSPQELLLSPAAPTGAQLSEALLSHSSSSLRLAAHSTLHLYWQSRLMSSDVEKESLLLGYQPYQPQCDSLGQWLSQQCHPSTGQCWCVDEDGRYITGSLSSRSTQPPQCPSRCQRAQSLSYLSDWTRPTSDITSSYSPSCNENGQFSVLQTEGSSAWCVDPVSGETVQPAPQGPDGDYKCPGWCALQKARALSREVGVGFEPECDQEGAVFSALQCDQADCWCVSEHSGLELPGTRTPRRTGQTPSCDRPRCPLAFGAASVSHGSIVCQPDQRGQRCEVLCHQGYVSVLPAASFLCDPSSSTWLSDAPLSNTCQRSQVFQTVSSGAVLQLSLKAGQRSCDAQRSELQSSLLRDMRATGLCSVQMSGSSQPSGVSVCDESSVSLECVSEERLTARFTLTARLFDLPATALPDLHDVDMALSSERLVSGLLDLMGGEQYQPLLSATQAEALIAEPSFSCAAGYQKIPDAKGCVVCPAGTFSSGAACSPCPSGTYQERAGQSVCRRCPVGTSTVAQGAFSATQCLTSCQRSGMQCTMRGDFLSTQEDVLSGRWQCVTMSGQPLPWTSAKEPITEQDCAALQNFDAVPEPQLVFSAQDSIVLRSETVALPQENQLRKCALECSQDESCQHVAVYSAEGRTHCDLYSTDPANTECRTTEQTQGFLGNPVAELYQSLSCSLKLRVEQRPDLTVLRKKGHEFSAAVRQKTFERLPFRKAGSGVYRTLVFAASGAKLADAHRFCADICSQEACCDGFILNQNILNGGSLMCGLLSHPDVLLCSEADWDVAGLGQSSRICGAGVQYNKQNKRFTFNFGGQVFNITDTALPASSKNKTDYQASIIGFQRVYIWRETDMTTRSKTSACASSPSETATGDLLSGAVLQSFGSLEPSEVEVDPKKALPSQQYWIFKHQFTLDQAQLWCLKRCEEEELCHISDLRDEGSVYFLCELYPDTRVCGAYDKPLRQACSLQLPREPQRAHSKRVDLTGSVESFYARVPFKKMVSYSVRSRVNLSAKPITEGFFECERRCDEDPCCRGIGYVKDTASSSSSGSDLLCLTLNSLGIQTCGETDRTSWRVQDCSPSKVETQVYPFGWYEKPVNQWTRSPSLCPAFGLRSPSKNVAMLDWKLLDPSAVLVDPSLSMFDIVHISKDIAGDADRVRDWCLAACEESVSCVAVSLENRDSSSRCVLYPDTHTCVPTEYAQDCRLRIREPASQVYLRTALRQGVPTVVIPGHGQLLGQSVVTAVGVDRKNVLQFLGIPYAQPPINALRFSPPQPADWTESWNATFPRPSCIQPGVTSGTSEDCLYLNVFVPAGLREAPVLVFFHNPTSTDGPGLLDGSYLATVGNVVVVTASFRVSAFGFLIPGSDSLPGNYGLLDQMAALQWVHKNIGQFGGDPKRVTLGAERSGADIASLHLTSSSTSGLFHRVLLMGGSVFSPAAVQSPSRAQEQSSSLGRELGCSTTDSAQLLACLRAAPAEAINAAQTKLLAVSGPLQAWSPVLDMLSVKEDPASALRGSRFHRADLLLGSSAEDGLISRARNIKKFEELQGRADSKTAFYEALSNSLGGPEASAFVKEAASWFYSLQHTPSPAGYNVFSRALENATRDLFIICPSKKMAEFWAANTRSSVFMYHLPEDMTHTSAGLSMPLDVQLVFGLPHNTGTQQLFSTQDRTLSTQMMTYMANFIKTGDPNAPLSLARVSFAELLPVWPRVLAQAAGDNYKQLTGALSNSRTLRRAECSFWNDYVPDLKRSTANLSLDTAVAGLTDAGAPTPETKLAPAFTDVVTQSKPKSEKDAYN